MVVSLFTMRAHRWDTSPSRRPIATPRVDLEMKAKALQTCAVSGSDPLPEHTPNWHANSELPVSRGPVVLRIMWRTSPPSPAPMAPYVVEHIRCRKSVRRVQRAGGGNVPTGIGLRPGCESTGRATGSLPATRLPSTLLGQQCSDTHGRTGIRCQFGARAKQRPAAVVLHLESYPTWRTAHGL